MSELLLPSAGTPEQIEVAQNIANTPILSVTPWSIQTMVYEIITSYFTTDPPELLGFPLKLKYNPDRLQSDVYIDMAYKYEAAVAGKRPAIFIRRGDVSTRGLTMGHTLGMSNFAESETARTTFNTMSVEVHIIAAPIAQAEHLAEYIKQALLYYQQDIQRDFYFRRFRVVGVTAPQIYVEAKENFVIMINIEVAYDDNVVIKSEDLKLKTVSRTIFDAMTQKPFPF